MTPEQNFRREFIDGSGILPELVDMAITVASDIELLPTGDVSSPLHEALGWNYVRFGHQIKESMVGAILTQEDGSPWQVKLENPRKDGKGKSIKYETPKGAGSRAYLPEVPASVRQKISERYGISVPIFGSFWRWLELHPEIPILWEEGGKKSLSLLSHGFVAIALNGVNGGYRKQVDDSRVLTPDVLRFAQAGRTHFIVFDQDKEPKTQRRVNVAITRFGTLLEQSQGSVKITSWDSKLGKGVDDLIVQNSILEFEKSYSQSLLLSHWRITQKLSSRLTYKPYLKLNTADLATLELPIPDEGIIAITSGKGTGKTKFITSLVGESESVLSATHRVALGRNLCSRLGLHWRGDLDKVGGRFITGQSYTLRVGFCVDSLLAINPESFGGCDLVLDEVCQVIRHLLTSATCAKEGKRPALLARFRELVQVARRVIVADADLDNATLAYLQELRTYLPENQDQEVKSNAIFLIENSYQGTGYPVRFLEAPDRTHITSEILEAVATCKQGRVIFIATDSKGMSKAIARAICKLHPNKRVLVINSETSGGEIERDFTEFPDRALLEGLFDVIIVSPSMATGVSIEAQGVIAKVFGIFSGVSSTDGDMAQALGRVREQVERVVWCTKVGINYSKISRATNVNDFSKCLRTSTAATVRLVRSSLKEDVVEAFEAYDYANSHINLFVRLSVAQNQAMSNLRESLLVRLQFEGNQVQVECVGSDPAMRLLLKECREVQALIDAEDLVSAEDIEYADMLLLEQKEVLSPEEHRAIAKFYLKEFYALDHLTVEDVLWDKEGRKRSELLALEVQFDKNLSLERTVKAIEKHLSWSRGITPWDVPTAELKRELRSRLGLEALLEKMAQGWQWIEADLEEVASLIRAEAQVVKAYLNFTVKPKDEMSDTQVVHQLLSQLGVKFTYNWSRSVEGFEGKKLRVYQLECTHWQTVSQILERRKAKREALREVGEVGSPPLFSNENVGGDPVQDPLVTAYLELLEEALSYGVEAVQELWHGISEQAELLPLLPPQMVQVLELI
jgi:Domain of unknown function (DUF3854)